MSMFGWRDQTSDPWFRLGRLEVGTVMAVVLAVAASWVAWVAAPSAISALAYSPEALLRGQVWRLFTWPLANDLSLWSLLNLFFFWYFGTDLERSIGRSRMLWLLVGIWGAITAAYTFVGLGLSGSGLAGIGVIEFALLLVWIAENPRRPFFFGIPAWVLGLVFVGLQVLQLIAYRAVGPLLSLVLSLVFVAIVARRAGLLSAYPWIPGARTQRRPKPARTPRAQARQQQQSTSDRQRLDDLLDKISEHGLDGLSAAERRELMKLRNRLRGA